MRNKSKPSLKTALTERSKERRTVERRSARADRRRTPRNDLLPKLVLETRPIDQLKLPERRVRRRSKEHIAEVREAMAALGVCYPIIISKDGEVIDGATRLESAKDLGLQEAPCIVVSHLTEEELRLLRLAVNRLGEKGEWDFDALRLEVQDLVEIDVNVEIAGFAAEEIDIILLDETPGDASEGGSPDDAPMPPEDPISRTGDIWRLGEHIVACGDARDPALYEILMTEEARLILSDPPFNVPIKGHVSGLGKKTHDEFVMASGEMSAAEFEKFLSEFIQASTSKLMDGGLALLFMDWRGIETLLRAGQKSKLALLNLIVWSKTNAGMGSLWRSAHELVGAFKKGNAPHLNNVDLGSHGRWRSNVWEYAGASAVGSDARDGLAMHPTVKPVAMLEDAILDVTARSEIVLDPFLGSGSTLIAAERVGRRCRGIELDPAYVDVVLQRWIDCGGDDPDLVETGEPVSKVRERRTAQSPVTELEEPGAELRGSETART